MEREAGSSMVGEIKSDPELFAIAIVLVGAHGDAAGALAAMERGAHDVLPDDADAFELAARVRAARRGSDMQELLLTRERELERLAYYDELTGLPNRRSVLRQLEALISRGRRHGHALALSSWSTPTTSRRSTTATATPPATPRCARWPTACGERLRTEDVAGRFGGEEFVIGLPDADAEGAAAVAEAVRAAVAARPLTIAGRELTLTVSVGWATWEDDDLGQLLAPRRRRPLRGQGRRARLRASAHADSRNMTSARRGPVAGTCLSPPAPSSRPPPSPRRSSRPPPPTPPRASPPSPPPVTSSSCTATALPALTGVHKVTGLAAGESIVGLDRTPTGELLGLTSAGNIASVDRDTGKATLKFPAPVTTAVAANAPVTFAVAPDGASARIITPGRDVVINLATGAATNGPGLTFAAGDPHAGAQAAPALDYAADGRLIGVDAGQGAYAVQTAAGAATLQTLAGVPFKTIEPTALDRRLRRLGLDRDATSATSPTARRSRASCATTRPRARSRDQNGAFLLERLDAHRR